MFFKKKGKLEALNWLKKIFSKGEQKTSDDRTKISHDQMQKYVDHVNSKFLVSALWNGYKIRMFKRSNLVIGGSQDWVYFHNIDVIFKKVIFFNLPEGWADTSVDHKEDLFRLSDVEEFKKHHPDFDPQDRHIFAFDLTFYFKEVPESYTYFVVAANVFFDQLEQGDGMIYYEDPLGEVGYGVLENRAIAK